MTRPSSLEKDEGEGRGSATLLSRVGVGSDLSRLGAIRVLVGLFSVIYLCARLPNFISLFSIPTHRFAPVGAARILSEVMPGVAFGLLIMATLALSITFTLGIGHRYLAWAFAFLNLLLISYRNSWGMIFHTENLWVLHLFILAAAPADRAFAKRPSLEAPGDQKTARWALFFLSALTVATYFVAGWAKVKYVGWTWLEGATVQRQVAYDNVRKMLLGDYYSPLGLWLAKFDLPWGPLAGLALLVELGAPLALLSARFARTWVFLAWSFHVGVILTMGIFFPYPVLGVAYASMLPVDVWWARYARGSKTVAQKKSGDFPG